LWFKYLVYVLAVQYKHPEMHDIMQFIFELIFKISIHLVRNVKVSIWFFNLKIFNVVQLFYVIIKHLISIVKC